MLWQPSLDMVTWNWQSGKRTGLSVQAHLKLPILACLLTSHWPKQITLLSPARRLGRVTAHVEEGCAVRWQWVKLLGRVKKWGHHCNLLHTPALTPTPACVVSAVLNLQPSLAFASLHMCEFCLILLHLLPSHSATPGTFTLDPRAAAHRPLN